MQVKNIFKNIEGGLLVRNAKKAIENKDVLEDLITIHRQYSFLLNILDDFENGNLTIKSAFETIKNIDFKDDACAVKKYMVKRLEKNGISEIMKRENKELAPLDYYFLENCLPTTIAVERSFSILSKILAKDRNFKAVNIKHYMVAKYNISKAQIFD